MKRVRNGVCSRASVALVALLCGLLADPSTAAAEGRRVFTARRALGLTFLGGSAVLFKQGLDFKKEADDFYERYKKATEPEEIDRLYQRTNNRDIKSQVSWALAAAFAISGVRLIFTSGGESWRSQAKISPHLDCRLAQGLRLEGEVEAGRLGFSLKRLF